MREFILRHKIIVMVIMLDAAILVTFLILFAAHLRKTALIQVLVAPTSANVTVNGLEYESGKTYRIEPGKLTVVVSCDGLETKTFEIFAESDSVAKVYAYLTGSDNDFSIYESNLAELELLRMVGQDEVAREFLSKMSIMNILPYHYSVFNSNTMEYTKFTVDVDRIDCSGRFCIQAVNEGNATIELMKEKIKEKGYNLDDYEVYYF